MYRFRDSIAIPKIIHLDGEEVLQIHRSYVIIIVLTVPLFLNYEKCVTLVLTTRTVSYLCLQVHYQIPDGGLFYIYKRFSECPSWSLTERT